MFFVGLEFRRFRERFVIAWAYDPLAVLREFSLGPAVPLHPVGPCLANWDLRIPYRCAHFSMAIGVVFDRLHFSVTTGNKEKFLRGNAF